MAGNISLHLHGVRQLAAFEREPAFRKRRMFFAVGEKAEQGIEIRSVTSGRERLAQIDRRPDIVRDLAQLRKIVVFASEWRDGRRQARDAFLAGGLECGRRVNLPANINRRAVMFLLND